MSPYRPLAAAAGAEAVHGAEFRRTMTVEQIEHDYAEECEQIEKDYEEEKARHARRLKSEVETLRDEMAEAHRGLSMQDIKGELMRDMDYPARTLRHQAERRRKRLDDGTEDGEDSAGGGYMHGKRRATRRVVRESSTRISGDMLSLAGWEVDADVKALNKQSSSSSMRRAKPPARLQ